MPNTTINGGGYQEVDSSCHASGTAIDSGGTQTLFHGDASGTVIGSGGAQYVDYNTRCCACGLSGRSSSRRTAGCATCGRVGGPGGIYLLNAAFEFDIHRAFGLDILCEDLILRVETDELGSRSEEVVTSTSKEVQGNKVVFSVVTQVLVTDLDRYKFGEVRGGRIVLDLNSFGNLEK